MTERQIDELINDLEFSLGGIDPRSWWEIEDAIDKLKAAKAAMRDA